MKKRIKINLKTLAVLVIAIIAAYVILHDIYMLSIYSWINKITVSWSWLGLFTWIISGAALSLCYDYIDNYQK